MKEGQEYNTTEAGSKWWQHCQKEGHSGPCRSCILSNWDSNSKCWIWRLQTLSHLSSLSLPTLSSSSQMKQSWPALDQRVCVHVHTLNVAKFCISPCNFSSSAPIPMGVQNVNAFALLHYVGDLELVDTLTQEFANSDLSLFCPWRPWLIQEANLSRIVGFLFRVFCLSLPQEYDKRYNKNPALSSNLAKWQKIKSSF